MVGSALVREIEASEKHSWVGASRQELDLTDRNKVLDFITSNAPDAVVIAAAKVGGILANSEFPVAFLSENLQIQTNLMDACHAAGVRKLVFLGSSCIYPKDSPQPMKPEHLLTSSLEPSNEPYAIAKISGVKLVQAYRKQFGHDWISLMPTNLYGPGDNFDVRTSHVIPGMMTKFCQAKQKKSQEVILWGTGRPRREFLHVDDMASATLFALDHYSADDVLNVGSGDEITIGNLAKKIASLVGFQGEIRWDESKPDGTPRKLLDNSVARAMGWEPSIGLEQGLAMTIQSLPFDCP